MHDYTGGGPHRRFTGNRRSAGSQILDVIPDGVGPRITTFRGGVVHSICPPGAQKFISDSYFAAVMLAPSPGITAAFASDRLQTFDAPQGMLVISPANVESQVAWSSTMENMVVAIDHRNMLDLAEQDLDNGLIDLQPLPFGVVDRAALQLAEMMQKELALGERTNGLLIDSLITIFGLHLLRTYSGFAKRAVQTKGGLSDFGARRVRDFLNENLTRKISVADLAALCDLSPGHFLQSFTRTFGEPPHKYLINLRLNFARNLLLETRMTISEVAYLSGFSSQSHLTSTMKRYRQVTPAQVRAQRS